MDEFKLGDRVTFLRRNALRRGSAHRPRTLPNGQPFPGPHKYDSWRVWERYDDDAWGGDNGTV